MYMNINVPQRPSDDEFKVHLESLFNPEGTSELDPADYVSDIYVPVLDDPILLKCLMCYKNSWMPTKVLA